MFADPSGRRARTMSGVGLAVVSVTLAALAIVVTGMLGFTQLPLTGLPSRGSLLASPAQHTRRPILVAGIRAEARIRGVLIPAMTAPRDIDPPGRLHD